MERVIDIAIQFGGVLALLLIGWLVAKWIKRITIKVLTKVTKKHNKRIKKIGITFDIPKTVGRLVYAIIMYIVLTSALKNIGVDIGIIENLVNTTISLIPIALVADWVLNDFARTKKLIKGKL